MSAFVGSKIISSSQGDKALSEFTSFHESSMSEKRLAFENSTDMSSDWINSL